MLEHDGQRPDAMAALLGGLRLVTSDRPMTFFALSLLVIRYAPGRYATEAFTWMSTCIVTGVGTGMAVGGQLGRAPGDGVDRPRAERSRARPKRPRWPSSSC